MPAIDLLTTIIQAIVKVPDAVSVEQTNDERGVLLTLTVDPSDMGIVIGKQGQMIDRIRIILKAVGLKNQQFVAIKVTDPRLQAQ